MRTERFMMGMLLCLMSLPARAVLGGTIQGTVVNESGVGIGGVTAILENGTGFQCYTRTREDGTYRFEDLPAGVYDQYLGYPTREWAISPPCGRHRVEIREGELIELKTVVAEEGVAVSFGKPGGPDNGNTIPMDPVELLDKVILWREGGKHVFSVSFQGIGMEANQNAEAVLWKIEGAWYIPVANPSPVGPLEVWLERHEPTDLYNNLDLIITQTLATETLFELELPTPGPGFTENGEFTYPVFSLSPSARHLIGNHGGQLSFVGRATLWNSAENKLHDQPLHWQGRLICDPQGAFRAIGRVGAE